MAKFNFNLKDLSNPDKETPINLIVRWSNRKIKYGIGESIKPKHWETNPEKKNFQRPIESRVFPEAPELTYRLDNIMVLAKNAFRQFVNSEEREPEPDELINLLNIKLRRETTKRPLNLLEFVEQFIENAPKLRKSSNGKPLSPVTVRGYNQAYRAIKGYSNKSHRKVDFDTIDSVFYENFTAYMFSELNYNRNTVGKHIKTTKVFLNAAVEAGLTDNTFFRSKRFKAFKVPADNIYLNEVELDAIYKLDLHDNKRLDRVRDLFIVGCFTGLRFSDYSNIQSENIKGEYLEIKTKKTEQTVVIPLHQYVKEIMQKYHTKTENSLPPALSNVKFNKALKEICVLIPTLHETVKKTRSNGGKIHTEYFKKYELVCSHTARRSFATILFKQGLSSLSIMKITGHTTEAVFHSYVMATPRESANILKEHWESKNKI